MVADCIATMLASGGQPATASPALHRACGPSDPGTDQVRDASRPGARVRRTGFAASTAGKPTDASGPAGRHSLGLPAGHLARLRADDRHRDAYDNPQSRRSRLSRDLGTAALHDRQRMLPQGQPARGRTPPEGNPGWGVEIALDVQAVSSSCPNCHILLVEADRPRSNIGKSVNTAARTGRRRVSNSYGGDEFNGIANLAAATTPTPAWRRSPRSGDFGFGPAQFPASWTQTHRRRWHQAQVEERHAGTRRRWWGAGSGCSA